MSQPSDPADRTPAGPDSVDLERAKLDALLKDSGQSHGRTVHVGHPREIAEAFAKAVENPGNAAWFA